MSKDVLYPLRVLHGYLYESRLKRIQKKEFRERFICRKKENPNTVLLILTPDHGNLGDHAITYAETLLLKKNGIDYIEITLGTLYEWKYKGMLGIMNGFPLLINGGGNLGTLWFPIEELQREIMKKNPKSPIAILPNSIFYESDTHGQTEFQKSIKIYNQHKHLLLCAREKLSYNAMSPVYNNVKLIPDMVLSLPQQGEEQVRQGCLLCLRGDKEKTRTLEQEQVIRQQAEELFGKNVTDTDMVIPGRITREQRETALQEKFREFCGAELVITDRLHGMIFCAITGTPCIVIDSMSPKVRGCYEWIKHLDYIRFANDHSAIAEQYRKIPQILHTYNNSHLTHYYEELANDILSIL